MDQDRSQRWCDELVDHDVRYFSDGQLDGGREEASDEPGDA